MPPDSNSRGGYVTTQCTTQHPTYTVGSGFTVTEGFGSGIVLVGPTTWLTQDVLTFAEVANDLTSTSSHDPVPWEISLGGKNETLEASLISYGRGPACTSAFLSYAAANPTITRTAKSAGIITLSNGQTTMTVIYSTIIETIGSSGVYCCGTCSLYFDNLQMLYWPAPHPNTACLWKPSADFNSTSTRGALAARDPSFYATDSDGYV